VDVHRADVRGEEVSNNNKRDARSVVEFAPTRTLHLAPKSVGPRVDTEVDRRERHSNSNVVDIEPTNISHVYGRNLYDVNQ